MGYKELLSEVHRDKVITQEVIDRCHANEVVQATNPQPTKTRRARKPLTLAQRQERLQNKIQKRASRHGMTPDQWWQQAQTYYAIDPTTFVVTSAARSPNPNKKEQWGPFGDLVAAQEKVYQLIGYKDYDHFVKGHDFRY